MMEAQWLQAGEEPSTRVVINTVFTVLCIALMAVLILGIALFYSGLTQRKSAFQQLSFPLLVLSEVMLLWLCFGYSLSFSTTGSSGYLGNFKHVGLRDTATLVMYPNGQDTGVVGAVFAVYHGMFAASSAVISMGCVVDRGRVKPVLVFMVLWLFLVYCPIAYWVWNPDGWMHRKFAVLDFAGGHVVHMVSGITGMVYSWFLGYRSELNLGNYRSSNLGLVLIGTVFMMIGWIGFNCGSLFTVNMLTGVILCNTLTSMAVGGIAWMLLDCFFHHQHKLSMVGLCSGCVSGLVAITPCTAYVQFWSSFVVGLLSGVLCNLGTRLKYWLKVDDALDVGVHLIGGIVGNLLAGVFADKNVALMGGLKIHGGWINRHFIQLLYQFLSSLITAVYVFGVCFILLFVMVRVPGLQLRTSLKDELQGLDSNQLSGEFITDYTEFIRQLNPADYLEDCEGDEEQQMLKND